MNGRSARPDATLDGDAAQLTAHLADGERLLSRLPHPQERTAPQNATAGRVHAAARAARHRFLVRHADGVYDRLTDARSQRPRLEELAAAAARHFPGLVPDAGRLAAERALPAAHREGRQVDQGIFFRALLRSPVAGGHLMESMLLPTPRALDLLAHYQRGARADLGTVRLVRDGAAAHVTLLNTAALNAEDEALVADLETAVDLVLLDGSSRVGVLRGGVMTHPSHAGRRVFCSGVNLKKLHAGEITLTGFLLKRELGLVAKLVHGLLVDPSPDAFPHASVHKPWVGAVDGFAIGGGMQLLLALDHVIASQDAYFSLPAAQEGIVPGAANLRLGRFAGARLNRGLLLRGLGIRATDAEASAFCDEVVPDGRMGASVERAAAELDHPSVAANRRMLALAQEPLSELRAYLAEFAYVQAERSQSSDVLAKAARFAARGRAAAQAG